MLFDYVAVARDRQGQTEWLAIAKAQADNFSWQSRCQNFKWRPVGHGRGGRGVTGSGQEPVHISVP